MANHVPQELLSQLLMTSPIKTLLICRSVCKWWKQVIDSPSFIADHVALQKPRLLATNTPFKYLVIDPRTLPKFQSLTGPIGPIDDHTPYLIASVHGVICLYFHHTFLLWNPTIRRLDKLPNRPIPKVKDFNNCYSFWIDPCTGNWKIAAIDCESHQIHLLSSRNQSWIQVPSDSHIDGPSSLEDRRQVLIDGVAYWTAYIKQQRGVHNCCHRVVAYYDFPKDEFGTIAMPSRANFNNNVHLWQGCLSMLYWGLSECELWTMRDRSWSKMFSVWIDRLTNVLHWDPIRRRILAQNGRDDRLVLCEDYPGIWYNRTRLRLELSEFIGPFKFSVSYQFVESLVFPDLGRHF